MLGLQLFVEGQQVELHDNESITLTQTLQDIRDIQKIFTDFSRTFNVPASKTNNKIFKHFYNFDVDGFDARGKRDAELFINYKPFKKGRIRLEGVQMQNNAPLNYRLTFFGKAIDFRDLIGDDKLDSLTMLDDFLIQYDADSVVDRLSSPKTVTSRGETFDEALLIPLITHTQRLYYDSTEDIADTGNLYAGGSAVKGVEYDQLKPAIRVYTIIRAIEEEYGLDFSDDFFNKNNQAFYNIYMWLHHKKGSVLDEDETNTLQQVTNFSNITLKNASNEFNGNFNRTHFKNRKYDNPSKVNREIKVTITTTSTAEYDFVIKKDGEEWYKEEGNIGTKTFIDYSDDKRIDVGEDIYTFHIQSADTATFTVKVEIKENYKKLLGWGQRYGSFSGFITISTDVNLNIGTQLPEIGVLDFLTGIFKMFNLTAFQEDDKIKVLPLDDFYASSTKTYDITEYLDKSSSEINAILPYREITFEYEGLGAFFAAFHKQLFNKDWGTAYYDNKGLFDGDSYKITLPFEHHKFERIVDAGTNTRTSIQWGWSVDDNQDPYIGQPLLFYPYKISGEYDISVKKSESNSVTVSSYYIPSNSINPKVRTQSLNFNAELSEYQGLTEENSLFNNYYKTYITDSFKIDRRLSTFKAYIPMSIILNIKLQDKIIIFNNLYKINKLTTNFETGLSELELINEVTDFGAYNVDYGSLAETVDSSILTADTTLVTADNSILTI